ncbi:hypothetical protein WR25_20137 isoform B [Diploscapter pachys]|uniref:Pre-mRNA-splicing factor 38 n=1 Tax=Diploscapter pachys TaxID=2018661 RepID=A0A2A2LRF9_9BILA|nr:hypothetical protein WR25_20137 isoform B [Diploscapter pachys]
MDQVSVVIQQQIASGQFMVDEEMAEAMGVELPGVQRPTKKNNILPLWGNQSTMNLNGLVLENVKESYYYKNHLMEIEGFQPLVDEIFYKVKHLEPWEKGTRKIQGMTGMCGGVRGVGAGGVVSSAFCILFRLFNMRITRKQLLSMLNSRVSHYIRGIGFMYVRFTQPPADMWSWYEPYMDDEDEVDPRSGGGDSMTFGQLVRILLTKLDWYGTLFPRIPIPIQKDIDEKFVERKRQFLAEQEAWEEEQGVVLEAPGREQRVRERSREKDNKSRDRDRDRDREARDRRRVRSSSRDASGPRDGQAPKPSRCSHHLRHHHCRKHRNCCPKKAKLVRQAAAQQNSNENGKEEERKQPNEHNGQENANTNECMALYTNCIYYTLWKSYDLLWFWMHLTLCSCFSPLRKENYLIVWTNLIMKRCTTYPNSTFKEIYLAIYGGKGTKSERALQRMDTIEIRERESRRQRKLTMGSSSSSDEEEETTVPDVSNRPSETVLCGAKVNPEIIAQEEEEARKYAYIGEAVDSKKDLLEEARRATNGEEPPARPPRPSRSPIPSSTQIEPSQVSSNSPRNSNSAEYSKVGEQNGKAVNFNLADRPDIDDESSDNESDTNSTSKWLQKMPNVIKNKFNKYKDKRSNDNSGTQISIHSGDSGQSGGGLLDRFKSGIQIPSLPQIWNRTRSYEAADPNSLDILRPDYTNTYDILDETKRVKREKRDRKALTNRVRKRIREELKEAARIEKKRRKVSDAIELLLGLLRMICSFAVLTANIRKTFVPAQIKPIRPRNAYFSDYELQMFLGLTTLLDCCMFLTNFLWWYCLQWHLFCRLGFVRFWTWCAILLTVAMTGKYIFLK